MLFPTHFFLLIFTFLNLSFGQISFSDPISSGTTCIPQATSSGLQVTCTGKGFFIVDPLLSQQNTINFQILSRTTEIGIGLGQRPDSSCFSTMFPEQGETWATCTPPSDESLNVPCNTKRCYFNQATGFPSSAYLPQITNAQNIHLDDLETYQWLLTPPPCPLSDPTRKCWQIRFLQILPSTSSSMTFLALSVTHSCTQASYAFTCGTPSPYALYFELEEDGNAVILFSPSSSSCSLSHCLSCPDNVHCQYCEPDFYIFQYSKTIYSLLFPKNYLFIEGQNCNFEDINIDIFCPQGVKYLRYLDIAYPKNLRNLLHSKPLDFLSAKTGIKVPRDLGDEESYDRAPVIYRRYIELPSSFLVNFWEDLLMLLILSGATLLVYFVDFFVKRSFGGNQKEKKPSLAENISGKVFVLVQSFLIIYMYKDGGDVVFFQILDFRTMNGYSGGEILNPFASIAFLIITVTLIGFHYFIILRYQKIKSRKNNAQSLEEYVTKKEKLQIFFKDYRDDGMTHQSFLLILVVRDIVYNFMLGLLFEYPLIQTILFPCYSLIMLVYIFIGRPFKRGIDNIQHFTCEILLFVVNICVMILAIMDSVGSIETSTRDNLGSAVIVINCLFNYVPTAFIVLKVGFLGYEFYQQRNKNNLKNEPVKRDYQSRNTSQMNSHHDDNQTSMMELVKEKGNLDISQDDVGGGRGAVQIFHQENSPRIMNGSYTMAKNETGYISTLNNNYENQRINNGQGTFIIENNSSFQTMRGNEKIGGEGGDIVYGDVEEGAVRVKAEPARRRKIKLGN